MSKRLIASAACAGLLLVLAPMAGAAPGNGQSGLHSSSAVAKACTAAQKADHDAFNTLWGKHAMRECIRAGREAGGGAAGVAEATNAAQDCRAEQTADPAAFEQTWGTNHNLRNAFGKCVSSAVHEDDAAE
jgi:hypothetical protein